MVIPDQTRSGRTHKHVSQHKEVVQQQHKQIDAAL